MSKNKIIEHEEFEVIMTQSAINDLNEIINFIAQNNPATALTIMERINKKVKSLYHSPYRGACVPELLTRGIKDYRQITETPWRIIYKVDDKIVNILTIIDSRRNLQDILIKKLMK